MRKVTARERWAVAKGESLFRFTALVFAVGAVIYVGVQLRPFWGIWRLADTRPRPAVEGVYRIGNDCFSFAGLPDGWRPARQTLDGQLVRIERKIGGFRVIATLAPHSDKPLYSNGNPPDRASDEYRLEGYTPWIFEGESLVFFSDGSRHRGRTVTCVDSDYPGWRPTSYECFAEDQGRSGKYDVHVKYESGEARYADPLLDEAYAALRGGVRSCTDGATMTPG